jgi:Pyruvate/2-oxoacid:ferredoxin oxidoreductase delta subunit
MTTQIYYYSGTGNSLWAARLLAAELGSANIAPMIGVDGEVPAGAADSIGLVFPVHMWGVPMPVLRFLEKLGKNSGAYFFALAVNAGQVSRTLVQLQGLMKSRGLRLSAGYDIVLPSNYIPWGGPGPEEKLLGLYRAAREKIWGAASLIAGRGSGPMEKGPLWQRIIFTALYKMTFNMIPKMDRDFWVDDKCNSCAICAKVCPAGNIAMEEGAPAWQHRCEQCLACIQWCPQEAIQYGKKTPAYERYHHPEVRLSEIMPPRR